MNVTPLRPTPFTDVFGGLINFQTHEECAFRELAVVDCLEAYGLQKGREKCRLLMDDFRECLLQHKQHARTAIMFVERNRQFQSGERKQLHAEDFPVDSY